MSRAFVKEDGQAPPLVVPRAPLPAGAPNYVTRRGLALLRAELSALTVARSSWHGGGPAQASELSAYSARLAALEARITSAVWVDPATLPHDEVRFSAAVTLRNDSGQERRYRIVGVDEADPSSGRITFLAPLARELMGKRVGDAICLRSERGQEDFEITALDYGEE